MKNKKILLIIGILIVIVIATIVIVQSVIRDDNNDNNNNKENLLMENSIVQDTTEDKIDGTPQSITTTQDGGISYTAPNTPGVGQEIVPFDADEHAVDMTAKPQ